MYIKLVHRQIVNIQMKFLKHLQEKSITELNKNSKIDELFSSKYCQDWFNVDTSFVSHSDFFQIQLKLR